jgi:hypothetical protein
MRVTVAKQGTKHSPRTGTAKMLQIELRGGFGSSCNPNSIETWLQRVTQSRTRCRRGSPLCRMDEGGSRRGIKKQKTKDILKAVHAVPNFGFQQKLLLSAPRH